MRDFDEKYNQITFVMCLVTRKNAGSGQLEFDIRDPQGIPLKVDRLKNSANEDQFNFLPTKTGPHSINLKFGGISVPGVPKTIKVDEPGQLALQGAEKLAHEVDKPAVFNLDTRQQTGGLKIAVHDPQGNKVRHSTNKRSDNTTEITFRPNQIGNYAVSVDFNNKKLSGNFYLIILEKLHLGSPYKVSVVEPRKVLVNDENSTADGSLLLIPNERNVIEIDAVAAGPGILRAEVKDSRGEMLIDKESHLENLGHGNYRLIMTPKRSGAHKIFLYFGDLPVPSAYPLIAHVEQTQKHQGYVGKSKGGRQE